VILTVICFGYFTTLAILQCESIAQYKSLSSCLRKLYLPFKRITFEVREMAIVSVERFTDYVPIFDKNGREIAEAEYKLIGIRAGPIEVFIGRRVQVYSKR